MFTPWSDLVGATVKEMEDGVRTADLLLVVLSPGYFESKYCRAELRAGLESGKPVIPVYDGDRYVPATVMAWRDIAPTEEAPRALRHYPYSTNLVRVIDTPDPQRAIQKLFDAITERCPGLLPAVESAAARSNELPVAPSACRVHLYVGLDPHDDGYIGILKEAVAQVQAAFVDTDPVEHLDLTSVVGPALAQSIHAETDSVLPCLVWVATGAAAATLSPDGELAEGTLLPTCSLAHDLQCARVRIDLAIVCTKYGAEWAAQQLCDLGVARVAIWISADPCQTGSAPLLLALAALTRGTLRYCRDRFSLASLSEVVADLFARHFATIPATEHGVIIGGTSSEITIHRVLSSTTQAGFSLRPLVPRGNFFDQLLATADVQQPSTVDVAHVGVARGLKSLIAGQLRARSGPSLIHVVPSWEMAPGDDTSPITGLLQHLCGQAACATYEVQFVSQLQLGPTHELDVASVASLPQHSSGIVWLCLAQARLPTMLRCSPLSSSLKRFDNQIRAQRAGYLSWRRQRKRGEN